MSNYTVPSKWASLTALTSDGKSPAFISMSSDLTFHDPHNSYTKWIPNYVHGTYNHVEGYYHAETRAAHVILYDKFPQIKAAYIHNNKMESKAIVPSFFTLSIKGIKENLKMNRELKDWQEDTLHMLYNRAYIADRPSGTLTTKYRYKLRQSYCEFNGSWIYPKEIYTHLIGCKMIDIDAIVKYNPGLNTNVPTKVRPKKYGGKNISSFERMKRDDIYRRMNNNVSTINTQAWWLREASSGNGCASTLAGENVIAIATASTGSGTVGASTYDGWSGIHGGSSSSSHCGGGGGGGGGGCE